MVKFLLFVQRGDGLLAQTVHDGALAFLVVVSSSNKSELESQKKLEGFATRSRYSPLHGEGRRFESDESIKEPIGITLN